MELINQKNDLIVSRKSGKSKIVEAFEKPKIYSLNNLEPLQMTLKYIFVLVGLRNIPSKEERAVLLDYIKNNYSLYSVEEIKLAFDLAIKGEFKCDLKHFEMFSCVYFSNIFNAYLQYREQIAKDYMRDNQKKLDLPKKISPEEILRLKKEFYNDVILSIFEGYKTNKEINLGFVTVNLLYKSLRLDHDIINISEAESNKIKAESKKEIIEIGDGLSKFMGHKKTEKEKYIERCRLKAIKLSFQKLIDKNQPLKFKL